MGETLLTIQRINVRFLNNIIFKNLSFTIYKGENWALIGPSGGGKSALLQTIAGRFNITGGEIRYHFFEPYLVRQKDIPVTHHMLVALVEPRHHFKNLSNTTEFYYQQRYNSSDSDDAPTVEQYLQTIQIKPGRPVYWDMDKTITTMRLENLREKQLIKLSNGETKRLMLAAALLKNPVLLLLDSPLTGLDVQSRAHFNALFNEITASGITVIIAASPDEIPDAVTHIAILQDGAITETIAKSGFSPALFKQADAVVTDEPKLKALLAAGTCKPAYNTIVNMAAVRIKYGGKVILENIDWQILPGERWALLGPNGAGKSTLLSLINGDNPQAYANDIILFDRQRGSGESIWDIKSKIGFVSPELHQHFPVDNSCLQVIESGYYDTLGLFRRSSSGQAATALQWMQALEIDKYANTLMRNIPASAQRLCLLARALVKNPDLLIFDEPCQGMDERQQLHFKNVVDAVCALSPVTLIYVTHYRHEIPASVTRLLELDNGRVVKCV